MLSARLRTVIFFQPFHPLLVHTQLACGKQWRINKLGLQRKERPALANDVHKLHCDLGADTTVELRGFTARLYGEARPCRKDLAPLVD